MEELNKDQIAILKKAFEAFDQEKKGCIGTVMVGTILGMLGHQVSDETLKEIIDEVDVDEWNLLSGSDLKTVWDAAFLNRRPDEDVVLPGFEPAAGGSGAEGWCKYFEERSKEF